MCRNVVLKNRRTVLYIDSCLYRLPIRIDISSREKKKRDISAHDFLLAENSHLLPSDFPVRCSFWISSSKRYLTNFHASPDFLFHVISRAEFCHTITHDFSIPSSSRRRIILPSFLNGGRWSGLSGFFSPFTPFSRLY